jgi:hypothetical protein
MKTIRRASLILYLLTLVSTFSMAQQIDGRRSIPLIEKMIAEKFEAPTSK